MSGRSLTEAELEQISRTVDPATVPELVRIIRSQQHELDRLQLSLEVTRREREELRMELVRMRKEPGHESGGE
jgi:hypothetical protein